MLRYAISQPTVSDPQRIWSKSCNLIFRMIEFYTKFFFSAAFMYSEPVFGVSFFSWVPEFDTLLPAPPARNQRLVRYVTIQQDTTTMIPPLFSLSVKLKIDPDHSCVYCWTYMRCFLLLNFLPLPSNYGCSEEIFVVVIIIFLLHHEF